MEFGQRLDAYLEEAGKTSSELAETCGLSVSTISRYRSGERKPRANSETITAIAKVLSAMQEDPAGQTAEEIAAELNALLATDANDVENFAENFDALLTAAGITSSEIAAFLGYDASYISRIRSGKRVPGNISEFSEAVSSYFIMRSISSDALATVADLIDLDSRTVSGYALFSSVSLWLCGKEPVTNESIGSFIAKMDEFDLDEFTKSIHYNLLKVPHTPFSIPSTKTYYGAEGRKQAEIDFLKAMVLNRHSRTFFMYNSMPIDEAAHDESFTKKFLFGMAATLRRGITINAVHTIDRPMVEMMQGLQGWLPLYMTGQVQSHYFTKEDDGVAKRMLYVSEGVVLEGTCPTGDLNGAVFHFSNKKADIAAMRKQADNLLAKTQNLMRPCASDQAIQVAHELVEMLRFGTPVRRVLPAPPIHTMPSDVLTSTLSRSGASDAVVSEAISVVESIWGDSERIGLQEPDAALGALWIDELGIASEEEFEKNPVLAPLSEIFESEPVTYTYDEYVAHIEATRAWAETHPNYRLIEHDHALFRSIRIAASGEKLALITKEKSPVLHFVVENPKLCRALSLFVTPDKDTSLWGR